MEDKERILVNKMSKEEYLKEITKRVIKPKIVSSIIICTIILIISIRIVKNFGIAIYIGVLIFIVIKYIVTEYNDAKKYYDLHMGHQGEETFILLPDGFKRQGETKLVLWLNLPKVKRREGIISFYYGGKYIFIWNEQCMSDEIKQYLKTKLRGLQEF